MAADCRPISQQVDVKGDSEGVAVQDLGVSKVSIRPYLKLIYPYLKLSKYIWNLNYLMNFIERMRRERIWK